MKDPPTNLQSQLNKLHTYTQNYNQQKINLHTTCDTRFQSIKNILTSTSAKVRNTTFPVPVSPSTCDSNAYN